MKKALFAIAAGLTALASFSAQAQLDKAASDASNAAQHKIDEKRADNEARKSGPVGKAVNNVKSGYHHKRAEHSANEAKEALKNTGK